MSANTRGEILAELGRGDEVAVAERLKAAAVTLTAAIDASCGLLVGNPDQGTPAGDERAFAVRWAYDLCAPSGAVAQG